MASRASPFTRMLPGTVWPWKKRPSPPSPKRTRCASARWRSGASRRASTIQALLAAVRPGALRILDINLRQHYFSREIIETSLRLANVVKCNDSELPVLAEMLGLRGSARGQIEQLARQRAQRLVCLTRGAQGSLLYAGGQWADDPGEPVVVKDTVGAGDAFTAALAMGMLAGKPLDAINRRANQVAALCLFLRRRDPAAARIFGSLRKPATPKQLHRRRGHQQQRRAKQRPMETFGQDVANRIPAPGNGSQRVRHEYS